MTADGEALIRTPFRELLEVLDRTTFRQVHRSAIVNMQRGRRDHERRLRAAARSRLKSRQETLPVSVAFMPLFRNM